MPTTVRLNLNGEFTAQNLDDIIREIAEARATLTPAVPVDPPVHLDTPILTQEQPQFDVRTLADGGLRIYLRNDGLGWLAFDLDATLRERLTDFITGKLRGRHTFQ